MYKCSHFAIHELVPPKVYEERGEKAWELLDDRALVILDSLRDNLGPITVNNYYWGGDRQWSGLRTPDSPWYSPYSQHTFGRAFDCIFKDYTAEEVREKLFKLPTFMDKLGWGEEDFLEMNIEHYAQWLGISAIEDDVSWLHFDVRNCEPVKVFKP